MTATKPRKPQNLRCSPSDLTEFAHSQETGGEEMRRGNTMTRGLVCGLTHTCAAGTAQSRDPRKHETHETVGHGVFEVNLPPSISSESVGGAGTNSGRRMRVRSHRRFVKRFMNSARGIIPSGSLPHHRRWLHVTVSFPKALALRNGVDAVSQMSAIEGNPN